MKLLDTIEGCPVTWDGEAIEFTARGRIDDDGAGAPHGDRFHLGDTSLHRNGAPLNADTEFYIVLPPQIIRGVAPIVLGSMACVTYRDVTMPAVVGDIGPHHRIGEMSIALARALGINPDANTGGDDKPDVLYRVLPGVPAIVNGIQYELQHS